MKGISRIVKYKASIFRMKKDYFDPNFSICLLHTPKSLISFSVSPTKVGSCLYSSSLLIDKTKLNVTRPFNLMSLESSQQRYLVLPLISSENLSCEIQKGRLYQGNMY